MLQGINSTEPQAPAVYAKDSAAPPSLSDEQLRKVLAILNAEYQFVEATSPARGYQVEIKTGPQFKAQLIPMGGARTEKNLIDLPEGEAAYTRTCPFCPAEIGSNPQRVFKNFKENIAVISNSGQILVVPKGHRAHWFVMPLGGQVQLIKDAMSLRNAYPEAQSGPIVLHCGAAGGQTVFHLHVRTNIFPSSPVEHPSIVQRIKKTFENLKEFFLS